MTESAAYLHDAQALLSYFLTVPFQRANKSLISSLATSLCSEAQRLHRQCRKHSVVTVSKPALVGTALERVLCLCLAIATQQPYVWQRILQRFLTAAPSLSASSSSTAKSGSGAHPTGSGGSVVLSVPSLGSIAAGELLSFVQRATTALKLTSSAPTDQQQQLLPSLSASTTLLSEEQAEAAIGTNQTSATRTRHSNPVASASGVPLNPNRSGRGPSATTTTAAATGKTSKTVTGNRSRGREFDHDDVEGGQEDCAEQNFDDGDDEPSSSATTANARSGRKSNQSTKRQQQQATAALGGEDVDEDSSGDSLLPVNNESTTTASSALLSRVTATDWDAVVVALEEFMHEHPTWRSGELLHPEDPSWALQRNVPLARGRGDTRRPSSSVSDPTDPFIVGESMKRNDTTRLGQEQGDVPHPAVLLRCVIPMPSSLRIVLPVARRQRTRH